jgi:hypothetical protein
VACCCCCCVRTMYVIIEAWIYPVLFLHVTQNEFMISLVLTARGCVSAAASSWCCATRTSRRNRRSCCFFFFMLCLFSFLPEEGERGLDQGGRGGLSLSLSLPLLYIYNHRGNSRLASSAEHGPSIFISFATQKDDKGQQSNKPWQALLLSQSVHAFMCHPHAVSIDPHQSKVKLGITTSMTEPQSIIIIL